MKKMALFVCVAALSQSVMAKDLVCLTSKLERHLNGSQIKTNASVELSTGFLKGFTLEDIEKRAVSGSIIANLIFEKETLKKKFSRTGFNTYTLNTTTNGNIAVYKIAVGNLDGRVISFKAMATELDGSVDKLVITEYATGSCQ